MQSGFWIYDFSYYIQHIIMDHLRVREFGEWGRAYARAERGGLWERSVIVFILWVIE